MSPQKLFGYILLSIVAAVATCLAAMWLISLSPSSEVHSQIMDAILFFSAAIVFVIVLCTCIIYQRIGSLKNTNHSKD